MVDAEALLDLVCGPPSPLPETHQRYRLVGHLGSGGQAEVYRAVRLCAGVSSAPVTVKVFRPGNDRPEVDQLRSWDKGDAVLMDLNSRGVPGICRRSDGFYGPLPHAPGAPAPDTQVPYQVLDYLHGVNLRDYVHSGVHTGVAPGHPRLDAAAALDALARTLVALHEPPEPGASPALHMDIKPSNVMVLPSGEIRLIDFTGARYHRRDHITSVAYTREAGGPEAFSGQVDAAYDVHGFGAVAYYLVTGAFPRTDSPDPPAGNRGAGNAGAASGGAPGAAGVAPPWAVLRRHPLLESKQALREHLLAPLADRPGDRPRSAELVAWSAQLVELAAGAGGPDTGVHWGESRRTVRAVGRAGVPARPVGGPDTNAWQRMERLEQELVELRGAVQRVGTAGNGHGAPAASPGPAASPASPGPVGSPERTKVAAGGVDQDTARFGELAAGAGAAAGGGGSTRLAAGDGQWPSPGARGSAQVPRPVWVPDASIAPPMRHAPEVPMPPGGRSAVWRRGLELSVAAALFAFVGWGIWALANLRTSTIQLGLIFMVVLAVAVGLFVLCRLVGRLVVTGVFGRPRRTARYSHAIVALFLISAGVGFIRETPWVAQTIDWVQRFFG